MKTTLQFSRILLLTLTLLCTGCMMLMHEGFLSDRPTFAEVEKTWSPLTPDKGRVVVFYPEDTVPDILVGPRDTTFEIDDGTSGSLYNRTFIWTDLTPGTHNIRYHHGWVRKQPVTFTVTPGQITFIQVAFYTQPQVIDRATALPKVTPVHHFFKDTRMWNGNKL